MAGTKVAYVKPHGALYHAVVHHLEQADAVIDAVRRYDPSMHVLGLPGSALLRSADLAGLTPVAEAFADRACSASGALVSRREAGAVLHDVKVVTHRVVRIAARAEIVADDGSVVPTPARSLCVHGDSPGAVVMATAVRRRLVDAVIEISPFVPGGGG